MALGHLNLPQSPVGVVGVLVEAAALDSERTHTQTHTDRRRGRQPEGNRVKQANYQNEGGSRDN